MILRIFHVIHVDIVSVPFDFWGSYVRESNRHVKAMVTKVAPQEIPSPFRECWWPHGAVSKIGWIMMDLGSMVLATKAAMTTPNYDPWQVRFPGGFAPGQAPEAQKLKVKLMAAFGPRLSSSQSDKHTILLVFDQFPGDVWS